METPDSLFARYLKLSHIARLDNYQWLIDSAKGFLISQESDKLLAAKLANEVLVHRSLMGSSKAYEQAVDIDQTLAAIGLQLANVAFADSPTEKIPFIEAALYYATDTDRERLSQELEKIKQAHRS